MRSKINLAIIGAGLWGKSHAEVFSNHHLSKLIGVYDINIEKANKFANDFSTKAYNDLNEMLSLKELDAVGIATPDYAHAEVAVSAAEAGKHILLEKPLATTLEDAEKIIEAVKRNRVRLMVDFHTRWNPPMVLTKNAVENGELGDIISAYFRLNDIISVPLQMLEWAEKSSILWFLGSHAVDTLQWIIGGKVTRVYSSARKNVLKSRGVDVHDLFQTILEFETGAIATIENSWIIPESQPNVNDIKFNIVGTKGKIDMDLTNSGIFSKYLSKKVVFPDILVGPVVHGKNVGFAHESIRSFIESIYFDKDFIVNGEDGLYVTKVILAMLESAEKKEPIEV